MQKADTLIRTKLHLPFTRPGLVSRPRLQEQIRQGLCGPLTLVTAPAGFGKTTLVAEWVESLKFLPPALPGARQARESAYPAQLDLQPSNLEDLSLKAKIDQPATHIAWLSLD